MGVVTASEETVASVNGDAGTAGITSVKDSMMMWLRRLALPIFIRVMQLSVAIKNNAVHLHTRLRHDKFMRNLIGDSIFDATSKMI